MEDPKHLIFCSSPSAPTQAALPVLCQHNYVKFSLTVPTNQSFTGPAITPIDPTAGQVGLPVIPIAVNPTKAPPK